MINLEYQEAMQMSKKYHIEHDTGMLLWELSLRHPDKLRNVRIPTPFPALTATCHVSFVKTIASSSTTGNLLIVLSPYGMSSVSGYYIIKFYNGAYADGVGGSANAA